MWGGLGWGEVGWVKKSCSHCFQHALDATLFTSSSAFQHALDATLFTSSSAFQYALDATLFTFLSTNTSWCYALQEIEKRKGSLPQDLTESRKMTQTQTLEKTHAKWTRHGWKNRQRSVSHLPCSFMLCSKQQHLSRTRFYRVWIELSVGRRCGAIWMALVW